MSSRPRNFRRRADDDDDNDTTTAAASTAPARPSSLSSASPKPSKKPQNPAPKKLLSFADDEEDGGAEESAIPSSKSASNRNRRDRDKPTSRLSKTSSSHKMVSTKDRLTTPSSSAAPPLPTNVQPQAGTYTKEALLELQKNTRTLAAPSSSSEPKIVLKGLLKPVDEEPHVSNHDDNDEEDDEKANKDETRHKLASLGLGFGKMKKDSSGSLIPDQATIDAIRAKRERMRQSRAAAPDYISLDSGGGASSHGAAEELSDEEPEFRERMALFGGKVDTGKKGVFEDFDERGLDSGLGTVDRHRHTLVEPDMDNDEDEEEKIWEEEQFRKGLGSKRIDSATTGAVVSNSSSVPMVQNVQQQQLQQNYMHPATTYTSMPAVVAAAPPSIGGSVGVSQGLDVMSIPQQAHIAREALQDNMRRLKESHGRTISSLTKTDENLSASLLNITALEKSLSAAGEKFIFMQKLRDYVSVLCNFLQHKAAFIEELEEQMQKLNEERASAILERRTGDSDDEMMELEAAVKAAMSVFNERGSSDATIVAARIASLAASASMREQGNLPVKLDEFGRDMNLQKRLDMSRRAEARQRRVARFESKRLSAMEEDGSYLKIEGESSTDESDSESSAYQSNRDLVLHAVDDILSDAAEEYSQLSLVKEKFERWKKDYSSSYRDAYMSLSVPAIFSPYVRLELLKWDPLHEDIDFFDMKWHALLFNYGMPEDGSEFTVDDADANLVPVLVEKVALPILHHEVAHCWDMLSTRETKNAVFATSLVINYVPASSEALAELLVVVRTRLASAVANISVPTWSPLVLKSVPNAARVAAYRFGMSVRLMRNICLWKEILALPVLEMLALDELLCGKILPHVRSIASNVHDAVTRTERIVASLYGVWAGPSVTGDRSNKLQPLVDYLMLLKKMLEKKRGVTENETSGLARRLKKMLVELNEYDHARDIMRTFHLKEAL